MLRVKDTTVYNKYKKIKTFDTVEDAENFKNAVSIMSNMKQENDEFTESKFYTSINEFKKYINESNDKNNDDIIDKLYDIIDDFSENEEDYRYKEVSIMELDGNIYIDYWTQNSEKGDTGNDWLYERIEEYITDFDINTPIYLFYDIRDNYTNKVDLDEYELIE